MSVLKEFKEFALRGNVVDLAVGLIIGASFQRIVNSMVNDLLTPPIGYVVKGIKFSDIKFELPAVSVGEKTLEPVTINLGNFLQAGFDFLIAAICVFMLVKVMNRLQRKQRQEAAQPAPPPAPPEDIKLLGEIRDLLKAM